MLKPGRDRLCRRRRGEKLRRLEAFRKRVGDLKCSRALVLTEEARDRTLAAGPGVGEVELTLSAIGTIIDQAFTYGD